MKIIIEITPADEPDMVIISAKTVGESNNMSVLRAISRIERAVNWEYQLIHAESERVKQHLL